MVASEGGGVNIYRVSGCQVRSISICYLLILPPQAFSISTLNRPQPLIPRSVHLLTLHFQGILLCSVAARSLRALGRGKLNTTASFKLFFFFFFWGGGGGNAAL